ncbi:vWA domain-containing protein [Mycobacterium sp. 23]|uniref:vWA domain-containing protein n=1 Tax=Mycobacterium sp. 23 TaxID=3400424 RepID=UPI003AABC443
MEPKGSILLVYFVADESGSMARNIGELNDGLITLQDELQKQPFAAARVRFSVIGFSDTAFTHLEAADLRSTQWLPTLTAQGLTSYAAAFDQLGYRISVDIPHLKHQGFSVLRPAVFFLTDGLPSANDNWRPARAHLLAQPTRPNILTFGIGDADAQVVAELATNERYAFKSARGVDTGAALSEFLTSLTQSVISSGQAVANGNAELQFDKPEGFTLAVDLV